jgi:Tfp pilus assembly protein PilO
MTVGSSSRLIVSILAVAGLTLAFWTLALGPKRKEADELSAQAGQLQVALSEAQSKAALAAQAKREFPADYRQLVVLGNAAPAGDETSSLLVELNHVATAAKVTFDSMQLTGAGETSTPAATSEAPATGTSSGAVPASATVPPTEAAASMLPLGANIGSAGLGVMPYTLTFSGSFFQVADFIDRIDGLVHTDAGGVSSVTGRLITLDGFALNADDETGFPHLNATFAVTTYVTPPTQGLTAGATPSEPAPVTTPAGAGETATQAASSTTSSSEVGAAR